MGRTSAGELHREERCPTAEPTGSFSSARDLRQHPTEAEERLWARLRQHGLAQAHFRRQHAIGRYVVDFCALQHKLILELDGAQHLEPRQALADAERTAFLAAKGYRVLRFRNPEVLEQMEEVLRMIRAALEEGNSKE